MYKDKIAALLSKKRIINVFAEITRESGMADEIVEAIISLNAISNDPITIHINSIGGESDQSLLAYDAIKFSKAPVHGIVIGKAFSGSAVILQACTKRLATANSGILVHYGDHHLKVPIITLLNEEKAMVLAKKIIQENIEEANRLINILVDSTKKTKEEIKALLIEDRRLSSQEALAFGLIDEII